MDYAAFYVATPLPGTALHREAVRAGVFPKNFWRDGVRRGQFGEIPDLVPDARDRVRAAYRSFYLRPAKASFLVRHVVQTGNAGMVAKNISAAIRKPAVATKVIKRIVSTVKGCEPWVEPNAKSSTTVE
jgi:hypothetical protein